MPGLTQINRSAGFAEPVYHLLPGHPVVTLCIICNEPQSNVLSKIKHESVVFSRLCSGAEMEIHGMGERKQVILITGTVERILSACICMQEYQDNKTETGPAPHRLDLKIILPLVFLDYAVDKWRKIFVNTALLRECNVSIINLILASKKIKVMRMIGKSLFVYRALDQVLKNMAGHFETINESSNVLVTQLPRYELLGHYGQSSMQISSSYAYNRAGCIDDLLGVPLNHGNQHHNTESLNFMTLSVGNLNYCTRLTAPIEQPTDREYDATQYLMRIGDKFVEYKLCKRKISPYFVSRVFGNGCSNLRLMQEVSGATFSIYRAPNISDPWNPTMILMIGGHPWQVREVQDYIDIMVISLKAHTNAFTGQMLPVYGPA